jgi:ubiquinone/menaquinone biosynthesis C-methylase UbiE
LTSDLKPLPISTESINRAFSKQSSAYDANDNANQVLLDMRNDVYAHVNKFLKAGNTILELNAGTGIDALHFAKSGHTIHATDLSDGMIKQIREKINQHKLEGRFTCQQLSYEKLDQVENRKFDYVFSNFGGLNCIPGLATVTKHFPKLLNAGAYITWVIMPPFCAWEFASMLNGNFKNAFRRLKKSGVETHLEGEYFQTYYHSLQEIKSAFGPSFKFIKSEGLAALTPQPHRGDFPIKYPSLYNGLKKADSFVRIYFPFNRWADHIIVTFQYRPQE